MDYLGEHQEDIDFTMDEFSACIDLDDSIEYSTQTTHSHSVADTLVEYPRDYSEELSNSENSATENHNHSELHMDNSVGYFLPEYSAMENPGPVSEHISTTEYPDNQESPMLNNQWGYTIDNAVQQSQTSDSTILNSPAELRLHEEHDELSDVTLSGDFETSTFQTPLQQQPPSPSSSPPPVQLSQKQHPPPRPPPPLLQQPQQQQHQRQQQQQQQQQQEQQSWYNKNITSSLHNSENKQPWTSPSDKYSISGSTTHASLCMTFPPLNSVTSHPFDATVKVILLGDYNVGKTSMLRSLSRARDENGSGCCCEFRPGELVTTILKRDRKRSLVKIMDTGGQEKYRSMTASYYRGVHGCLLIFDVTREETFANVMNWHQDLKKYAGDNFVTSLLVGTTSHPGPREVTPERAFKMAESLGIMYLECDSEDDVMIVTIVQRLIDVIVAMGIRKCSQCVDIKPQEQAKFGKTRKFCSC